MSRALFTRPELRDEIAEEIAVAMALEEGWDFHKLREFGEDDPGPTFTPHRDSYLDEAYDLVDAVWDCSLDTGKILDILNAKLRPNTQSPASASTANTPDT